MPAIDRNLGAPPGFQRCPDWTSPSFRLYGCGRTCPDGATGKCWIPIPGYKDMPAGYKRCYRWVEGYEFGGCPEGWCPKSAKVGCWVPKTKSELTIKG